NVDAAVKGAMEHQEEILTAIAEALAKIRSSQVGTSHYNQAQRQLDSAVSRMMVVAENYPQLTANQHVDELITEIEATENRIL
ncbi:LemA family protein, partial [Streptococcus suis]